VKRGDLIAFLGDPDENGGSVESPLEPHLHFGVRAGQRGDYPGRGEWRFQAGWIRFCPQDLGWLQPSLIITRQEIPASGYPAPATGFLTRWGFELLISGIYAIGGTVMLVFAIRKKSRLFLIFPGIIAVTAGIVFLNNGMVSSHTLLVMGLLILAFGIYHCLRRLTPTPPSQS
jgi:murein DD-endopeptidase MepM/ murein hydrolase activator NlpD